MDNNKIQFSIIIPLYNKGKEIARALTSIFNQTVTEYEIIVVNDGSTDNGPDVVMQIADDRLKLINQANAGVSVARNRGIAEAKFDYIAFLDADDEWKPIYLETINDLISQYPDAGAYATAYEAMGTDGIVTLPKYHAIPKAPWQGYLPSYFKSALGPPPVWTSAVTIPKRVLDDVGYFPEGVVIGQDKEVWERVAMKYRIAFSTTIGATYYLDASNRSCNRNKLVERPRPFIGIGKDAINNGDISDSIAHDFKTYLAVCQLQRAKLFLFHLGNPVKAREILLGTLPPVFIYAFEKYCLLLLSLAPNPIISLSRITAQKGKQLLRKLSPR